MNDYFYLPFFLLIIIWFYRFSRTDSYLVFNTRLLSPRISTNQHVSPFFINRNWNHNLLSLKCRLFTHQWFSPYIAKILLYVFKQHPMILKKIRHTKATERYFIRINKIYDLFNYYIRKFINMYKTGIGENAFQNIWRIIWMFHEGNKCFRKKRNIKTKVLFMNHYHELFELRAKKDPTRRSTGI